MVQRTVNIFQAFGKHGTYADSSPRRDKAYALVAGVGAAVAATGKIVFTANFSANDTITIGEVTLTAKANNPSTNEFAIGANLAASLANIAALSVADVVLSANATTLFVAASDAGVDGNEIELDTSVATATVTAMAGGVDGEVISPVLGRFYTLDSNGKCVMGGNNAIQLGVALNNGMVATFGGVQASVTVPEGTVADVCSFGHLYIASATDFAVGYGACYDEETGIISAYNTTGSVPAGNIAIVGAEFIQVAGNAGEVGILSLNGK